MHVTLIDHIAIRDTVGRGESLKTQPLKTIQLIDIDKIDPLFLTNGGAQVWWFCIFPLAGKAG